VGDGTVEAADGEREGRRRRRGGRRGGRRDESSTDAGFTSSDGREPIRESSPDIPLAIEPTSGPSDEHAAPSSTAAPREREWRPREERAPATLRADDVPTAAPNNPPAAIPVPHFELPTHDLEQLAGGAGLQWVQSDADKVRTVQQAIAAESPPAHVPRERTRVVLADDGPLVLVETRKDLSQLGLPFERQPANAPTQPPQ
jgi:ribonuclease E